MIRWSVEAIVKSECYDKILISTDSDAIFDAVADLPVERHKRPAEHATVRATALNAMLNLMERYEKYDVFSYFLPTCPFVSPEDIRKGVDLLSDKIDSVLPVFDNLECGLTNSKFIKKYYKPSGAFYISWWDRLKENKNFFKGNTKGVIIPKERSVDINDEYDILQAEAILNGA